MVIGCRRGPAPPAKIMPFRRFTPYPSRFSGRDYRVLRRPSPVLRHIPDERRQTRRAMACRRLRPAHIDPNGKLLAQLHAVLIEGIYAPDRALHEHAVLV